MKCRKNALVMQPATQRKLSASGSRNGGVKSGTSPDRCARRSCTPAAAKSATISSWGISRSSPVSWGTRRRALAAYDEVTMGFDRHHELELLADALGVPSD